MRITNTQTIYNIPDPYKYGVKFSFHLKQLSFYVKMSKSDNTCRFKYLNFDLLPGTNVTLLLLPFMLPIIYNGYMWNYDNGKFE